MEVIKDNNSANDTSFFQRIVTILAYVLFFNLFLFHTQGSVEFGLVTLGRFLFLTFIFVSIKNFKKNLFTILSVLIVLLFFGLGMLLRANMFAASLLGIVATLVIQIYAYILSGGIPMVRSLFELILAPIYFIGSYIKSFFKTIKIIFTGDFKQIGLERTQPGKNVWPQSLIVGLVIGLFIIGILISMLSNADPIFATFIKNIVSADFLQNLFLRVVLSLLFGLSLLPFIILKRKNIFNSPIRLLKKINFVREMSVVMALVGLVIGVFLVVQWPYVFAKVAFETDLSKFGVATYSEYVRKGFTELLKISLFVYGLIWTGLLILRENQHKGKNILKYIQVVVLGEFFIFLFSIFRRVWLYQTYHGWSIVRLYSSFLLIWIFGISIFLALRHFWKKRWVIGEIILTVVIIFTIGVFNIESFIVNNHPPTVNAKVDYVYLSRMSPDGYLGWEKAFEHAKGIINKYTNNGSQLNREERKEIAYAGIVIRELSGNYKDLIKQYGTMEIMKQYLTNIFTYQRQAYYKVNAPSNSDPIFNNNNYLEDMKNKIKDGKVDYKKTMDLIRISKSEDKYKFDLGSLYTLQSFYDISENNNGLYNPNSKDNKEIIKNKDSYLDRFFVWNYSKNSAYKNMVKDGRQNELLQLEGKYFEIYVKILNQPVNERSFDMDISLDSPLLD